MLNTFPGVTLTEESFGSFALIKEGSRWKLSLGGKQVMMHDESSLQQVRELMNHVRLAEGEVIATGLGLGLREIWLLTKPEVTKLTVLESSPEVIDYHMRNSDWLADTRVHIVQADAREYLGSCDTLLLDHWPDLGDYTKNLSWLVEAKRIQRNIPSSITWSWPLELTIQHKGVEWYPDLRHRLGINFPPLTRTQLTEMVESTFGGSNVRTY